MSIELLLEGHLEKEKDREIFSEMLKEICEEKKIKIEDYDTSLVMDVCPEGYVTCSFEGVFISIVAQTNVAGPGFHAFVAELYDAIMLKSGIIFEVGDETQYYENRDFESLKYKYFYTWLSNVSDYIKEHGKREKNMCICWPLDDYRPMGKECYVVTPMGYQCIDTFDNQDIEQSAEHFFIWNHQARDASYFRNCALALLWKECFFEYSAMNEHTNKIANMIIDYMEAAYDEDSTIVLPYKAYVSLCDTLNREKLIHEIEQDTMKQEIGYRKGIVFYPLGNWEIAVQGIQEKTFDDVTKTMNIMAPYREDGEVWTWLIKANELAYTNALDEWLKEQETYHTVCFDGITLQEALLQEEDYYRLFVVLSKGEEMLQIDCFIRELKDVEKLKQWCNMTSYANKTEVDEILKKSHN